MAMDEAIARMVRERLSPPTLRVYGWDRPAVSIGCFQKIGDIDMAYCREKMISVVRRPTGGRAILHGDEVTYSFSVTTEAGIFSGGLYESYKEISVALGNALGRVGIDHEMNQSRESHRALQGKTGLKSPLCFQSTSYGEITVQKRKVIGSAQKRWSDTLLQQGCIPFSVDTSTSARVFTHTTDTDRDITDGGLTAIAPGITPFVLKRAMRTAFEETFGVGLNPSAPSLEEQDLAAELEADKYRTDEWVLRI